MRRLSASCKVRRQVISWLFCHTQTATKEKYIIHDAVAQGWWKSAMAAHFTMLSWLLRDRILDCHSRLEAEQGESCEAKT